jgi:hypothetical protein
MAGSARLDQIRASLAGNQLATPPAEPTKPLAAVKDTDDDAAAEKSS